MPTLWCSDPRLVGDGLDHVVAVEVLQPLEVVERPARAAGAAHVDVDHGEAEQGGDLADPALRRRPGRRSRSPRTRPASDRGPGRWAGARRWPAWSRRAWSGSRSRGWGCAGRRSGCSAARRGRVITVSGPDRERPWRTRYPRPAGTSRNTTPPSESARRRCTTAPRRLSRLTVRLGARPVAYTCWTLPWAIELGLRGGGRSKPGQRRRAPAAPARPPDRGPASDLPSTCLLLLDVPAQVLPPGPSDRPS